MANVTHLAINDNLQEVLRRHRLQQVYLKRIDTYLLAIEIEVSRKGGGRLELIKRIVKSAQKELKVCRE